MLAQVEMPGAVRPNRVADPERDAWDAYLWIEDADALRAELAARGVTPAAGDSLTLRVEGPFATRPWRIDVPLRSP